MTKQFSLYTFDIGNYCYTETDNLKQALSNFSRRVNLDHNGYNHPNMKYHFEPIRIVTVQDLQGDKINPDRSNSEMVLKFNLNKLNNIIYKGGNY
tara:strand:- start:102 stop:386 length:285 start_codon:yes stop_codon:yes gene_type:complete